MLYILRLTSESSISFMVTTDAISLCSWGCAAQCNINRSQCRLESLFPDSDLMRAVDTSGFLFWSGSRCSCWLCAHIDCHRVRRLIDLPCRPRRCLRSQTYCRSSALSWLSSELPLGGSQWRDGEVNVGPCRYSLGYVRKSGTPPENHGFLGWFASRIR